MYGNDFSWTDERVETLRKLWYDGKTATQISLHFGEVTRNAVIGKIHRLGLTGRPREGAVPGAVVLNPPKRGEPSKPQVLASSSRESEKKVSETPRKKRTVPDVPLKEAILDPITPVEIMPIGHRVDIMMLTEKTCRWPIGDPGTDYFTFCGRKPCTGTPYCTTHARIAYQPAERRRPGRPAHEVVRPW